VVQFDLNDVVFNSNNYSQVENINPLTYTYTLKSLKSHTINFNGVRFYNLVLKNTPLFLLQQIPTINQAIVIQDQGLTFQFSSFIGGSHIFSENPELQQSSGIIISEGTLKVEYCTFEKSSIFTLRGNNNNDTQFIQNVNIIGTTFKSSFAFEMNTFTLKNIFLYECIISGGSKIFKTNFDTLDLPNIRTISNNY
jgi:hypothetical protein